LNQTKALAAVEEGICQFIADLAKREASNELTEPADTAAGQFKVGLSKAKDAYDRAAAVVREVFPE
jgi:hypothetical protein